MYKHFNIQQFKFLFTHSIFAFCVDLRKNRQYFPTQIKLTVFYNSYLSLYSPVVTTCTTSLTVSKSNFFPHTLFMCFVSIWKRTGIISLYNFKEMDIKQFLYTLQPSGHYVYHQFNIQQFCFVPHTEIWVLFGTEKNSHYFLIQHWLTRLYNSYLNPCSTVVTLCITSLASSNSNFCQHTVFMCLVWISEKTDFISLYNFN